MTMNKEGYKTPTEDMTIDRETTREKLRQQYGIREGDLVLIAIEVWEDKMHAKQIIRVKVKEIHKYFVTLQMPAGYMQSMYWSDFGQARAEGGSSCGISGSKKKTKEKKNI